MSEWERAFVRSRAVPPHRQRCRARPPGSAAFRCVLKYLEGAALAQVGGLGPAEGSPALPSGPALGVCPPPGLAGCVGRSP